MEVSSEQSVLLTFDEVRILLYSLGFTKCEGIYMPEKEFSEKTVIRTMHKLSKRKLLDVDVSGDRTRFVLKPSLERMLMTMGSPAGTFIYRPGESLPGFSLDFYNGPEYFCYMAPDYCLIAERDWTRRESLRLRTMDLDRFRSWQKERELEAQETMDGQSGQLSFKEHMIHAEESNPDPDAEQEQTLAPIL